MANLTYRSETDGGDSTLTVNNVNATLPAAMRFAPLVMTVQNSLSYAKLSPSSITVPNATNYGDWDLVAGTVTTGAMPNSIAFNAMSIGVSRQKLFIQFEG